MKRFKSLFPIIMLIMMMTTTLFIEAATKTKIKTTTSAAMNGETVSVTEKGIYYTASATRWSHSGKIINRSNINGNVMNVYSSDSTSYYSDQYCDKMTRTYTVYSVLYDYSSTHRNFSNTWTYTVTALLNCL